MIILIGEATIYSTTLWVTYWIDHPSSVSTSQFQTVYFLISASSAFFSALKVVVFALVHIAMGKMLHSTVLG